jgi:acetoin utilization protein AcuC
MTLTGFRSLYVRITALADKLTGGRLVACGGGGYAWVTVVPRAWTMLAASLLGEELPEAIPSAWVDSARALGHLPPETLTDDPDPPHTERTTAAVLETTSRLVDEVCESLRAHPVPVP